MLPSGIIYHSFLVKVAPEFTLKILAKGCCIAHVLVAPSVVTVLLLKGSTREVTTECSAPVSTINLLVSLLLLFLLWAHWSQGGESLVLLSLSLFMPGLWSPPLGIFLVASRLSHLGHLFLQCPFSLQQAQWSFAKGFWVSSLLVFGGLLAFMLSFSLKEVARRLTFFFIFFWPSFQLWYPYSCRPYWQSLLIG